MQPEVPAVARLLSRFLVRFLAAALLGLAAPAAALTFTDPEGDTVGGPGPDVVAISAEFSATQLLLDVSLAAGTLDPSNLAFQIALDVDLDPETGTGCVLGTFPCGAEYVVTFNSTLDPDAIALVDLLAPMLVTGVAVDPRTDGFLLSVPLGAGGLPDDGEVLFGIVIGIPVSATGFSFRDNAPSGILGQPLGGPSTPVIPEPGTALLLGAGLAALATRSAGSARTNPPRD
jgi:hypothetical protein